MIPFQALCHFPSIISLHGHQPKFAYISVQTLSRVHHQAPNLNHWKYLYQNRIHIQRLLSTAQHLPMIQRLTSQIRIQFPAAIFKATLISQSSRLSFFLQENRVKIRTWHISNKISHPNNLGLSPPSKSYEDYTNDLLEEARDLKLLCKQAREAFVELNAAVKADHLNTKWLDLSFHSAQESVRQMGQALPS